MKYQYVPYESRCYATMLRREASTRNLMWDNTKGQTVLILQCPYGDSPFEKMEEVCRKLETRELEQEKFTEILPGVWGRMVTAVQKSRGKGCPLRGEASTSAVFCCENKEDVCYIHAPQSEKKARLDIPAEMNIHIEEETVAVKVRKGLFKTVTEIQPKGFFRVDFSQESVAGYNDGDLVYRTGNLEMPITRQMIENGSIFFKTDKKPDIHTENQGLLLKIV